MVNTAEHARIPLTITQPGIAGKEVSGRVLQPSRDTWESVISEGNIGTSIFPQTYFAQGLYLARAFATYANKEGLPLSSFVTTDPPDDLVETVIGTGKIKAHAGLKIETNPTAAQENSSVWDLGRDNATGILRNFTEIVTGVRPRGLEKEDSDLLDGIQHDPRFLSLLDGAVEGLMAKQVVTISHRYKRLLIAFAHTYAPYIGKNVPEEYEDDKTQINYTLNALLVPASDLIREHFDERMSLTFPEDREMLERLAYAENKDLFGRVYATRVDPLKTSISMSTGPRIDD